MLRATSFIAIALVLASSAHAQAQVLDPGPAPAKKPPSPEEMQKSVGVLMDGMVPTMGRMTSAVIEAQLVEAEKPETAERLATFKRNLFDALLRKGFTREQALQLTTATAMPGANGGSR